MVLHIYFIVVTYISKSRLNSKGRPKVPPQEVHPKQENYCRACEERTRYPLLFCTHVHVLLSVM